jgi:hypothetical protein
MRHNNNVIQSSGFALLITLIVVSVVISIGITLLDLTIKQLRLSTGSKDSESSFHAANAGVECVRSWRVPVTCFGSTVSTVTIDDIGEAGKPVYLYEFEVTWGASSLQRCSKVSMITISPPSEGVSYTLASVDNYLLSYPEGDKICEPGGRCTIISVEGYNRQCSGINQIGTIQREVLLEL